MNTANKKVIKILVQKKWLAAWTTDNYKTVLYAILQ